MNFADVVKKLLGAKQQPTRAAIEKAIAEAQNERARAETTIEELSTKRREILLRGTDEEAAAHDARVAAERRAADRATALIDELDSKLQEVAEREREEAISAERRDAEAKIGAGVEALERYDTTARQLREMLMIIDAGEQAAKTFNGRHPDEPAITGPETLLRWIAPAPKREIKRERKTLWVRSDGTPIEPGSELETRIRPAASGKGSFFTESGHRHEYTRREFDVISFVPQFYGFAPKALRDTVVLPTVRASDPHFHDPEHRLPHFKLPDDIEVEIVPISTPAPAETPAAINPHEADEAA